MKKSKKLVVLLLVFVLIIVTAVMISWAATEEELKAQQKDLNEKIDETKSELSGVKAQKSTTLSQITRLNEQISNYQGEIYNLEAQLDTLNVQIDEKQQLLDETIAKYNEQQELLNRRIVMLYESGSTSYLDMLLSADGLSDFISRYYLISQLAEYDQDLLNKIEATKNQVETEKAELDTTKQEVETAKDSIKAKKDSISVAVADKNRIVSTLSAEEAELNDELEELEADKRQIQSQLAAIARGRGGYTLSSPSESGYICPLPNRTRANITTGYGAYRGHTGSDFACPSGTPIYAVKDGDVVISTDLVRANGTYRSYGRYVVVAHNDGTMTLYAHMSSRAVSQGQHVSQGQVIGYVGSTGNSTGPHLHFEVRINGSPVNPYPYLP